MKIIIAILIFSAIILFHELGHFLFAKLNKIVVTEFSLGMGPRLLSTEKNGTRYSLKLLPIGGSCAMLGEDTDIENPFRKALFVNSPSSASLTSLLNINSNIFLTDINPPWQFISITSSAV